ncbi:hypothetical protein RKE29_12600 [Streptomyces sp. B1866]|uniref:hypothetical protein n=1 Tax=Streptomyces sp. B1866 TaxID=3075431 RepID=UPI00289199D1|nr:hypothetical protein [Streptomyces sp. B1866]MDT3397479.1 hypothetical protein [Streptomyces sp. B1866]
MNTALLAWLDAWAFRWRVWWELHGQWTVPVRLLSPRRRRVHALVEALCAAETYAAEADGERALPAEIFGPRAGRRGGA